MNTPQVFGKWNGLATAGEMVKGWARWDGEPIYYGERVANWLRDRGVRDLPAEPAREFGWCESGAEAMLATGFAPDRSKLVRIDTRILGYLDETLEIQVDIEDTPYRADFRWTSPHGVALIEVWGAAAHAGRRSRDRVRHDRLSSLGHTVHYVPAEGVMRHPAAVWSAIRRRQREAWESSHVA